MLKECLALHLGIEEPLDDFRVAHASTDDTPAEGTEKEIEYLHLMFHLAELGCISLGERLSFDNSTLGIGGSDKGIVQSLTRQLVGKSASIANQYHVIHSMRNGVQRNIGATDTVNLDAKLGERLAETGLEAGHIIVQLHRSKAIHIATVT